MPKHLPLKAGLAAILLIQPSAHADIIAGNLTVTQNDTANNGTSVSASFGYTQGQITYIGGNRGDFGFRLDGATVADDYANGMMIVTMSQNGRSNEGTSAAATPLVIGPGLAYSTPAIQQGAVAGASYSSSINVGNTAVTGIASGNEWNANHSVGYFKYSEFLGGWATNSINNGPLTSFISSSPGLTLGSGDSDPGTLNVFDNTASGGAYTLNLAGLSAPGTGVAATSQNGILLVVGGRNEDNYALSNANADGTFTMIVKDNDDDGAGGENDGVGFVYVPVNQPGVLAMGRIDGDGNTLVGSGDFVIVKGTVGQWYLSVAGQDMSNSTLLMSPEGSAVSGTLRADNIWSYEYDEVNHRWVIQSRDIPGSLTGNPGLQDLGAEPAFSFVLVPEPSSALLGAIGMMLALRRRRN